ncbi:MAG: Unknown protein [uncultured Thiotrichaceae bacterium]|uniref:histidine kinase n=1 Tax=uncultured Thiotrichaceae bacterium TaxID=298394 RepID=A0A6S6UIY8_9GAMM|nr:MAG: Unknown protein [uncultured Thiotrichaceae bacterium]
MATTHTIKEADKSLISYLTKLLLVVLTVFACNSGVLAHTQENTTNSLSLSHEEQAWLEQHSEVLVGFANDFPPVLSKEEDGQYQGILPDIFTLLTRTTGINFHLKTSPTWAEMLKNGYEGETDMLGWVAPRIEHTKHFTLTQPFHRDHFYIYGPGSAKTAEYSLDDLTGKLVGYIGSAHLLKAFAKKHPKINFKSYANHEELVNALITKQIAFIVTNSSLEYWRQQKQLLTFKIYGTIPDLETEFVMAIRKDWPELTSILNKALSFNKTEIQEIIDQWLGHNIANKNAQAIELSAEEKAWLAKNPILQAGFDPQWAPIEFIDQNGEPQGISIQYLQKIEDILNVKFEYNSEIKWSDTYKKLVNSKLDLLPALSPTKERLEKINLTKPYLSIPISIFSAVDRAYLGGLNALEGKRVIVVENYAIQTWLEQDHPTLELITAPTIKEALNEVARGNAYAFVGNLVSASYYIGQSGLNQIRVVGETSYRYDLAMAVRKDWELLPRILQKAIDTIPESERNAIYNDWISIQYKYSVDYTLLWQVLGAAILLLLITTYWIRRLAKEVSQRRQIEADLRQAKQEADQASKEALQAAKAKSDFLTNMSHEIRTPMSAVVSAGHLLLQTQPTSEQREYLDKMTYSSEALLTIIDDILDFSRGEASQLTLDAVAFSIRRVIQKIQLSLEPQANQKGLSLAVTIAPNVPDNLIGDPGKLSQVLRNLSANAIKFTERGNIEINVELLSPDITKAHVRFTIKDTGPGISPEIQKKLFQPFSQGDASITRQHGGTGLGLVISQQLTKLMGSNITIDTTLGKGSAFSFVATFDVCELQSSIKPLSSKKTGLINPFSALTGIRVLLVEDDEMNQYFEKKFLLAFGIQAEIAAHGKKALEILEKESFDIVLMDIQMPVMDGYETTRRIRSFHKWQTLPIIALTAHAFSHEREKCMEAGMNDYLSKPFDPEHLRDILLKWVAPEH